MGKNKGEKKKIAVIDLFCGAGGLTHGLKSEGFDVRAGLDLDPQCRYAYEANNGAKYLEKDVARMAGSELEAFFQDADYTLLAGCAPCQPFSKYTQGKGGGSDEKWKLLNEFGRLIEETAPDFVTMENVPQLARHPILEEFVKTLENLGYQVFKTVIRCADYGIPQSRERLVLLASRYRDVPLELVNSNLYQKKTVREAIAHLPPIGAGGIDPDDSLHRSSSLSALNQQRIRVSTPGGSWKDWPAPLRAACHNEESGKTYVSVYGRMTWDAPAPTEMQRISGPAFGYFLG